MSKFKALLLGNLNGEADSLMADYAIDVDKVNEERMAVRALLLQISELEEAMKLRRAELYLYLAEQKAGDKVAWGNEAARDATLLQALDADDDYETQAGRLEDLKHELNDVQGRVAACEERLSARRWWVRLYLAQALEKAGGASEGMGLE